MESRDQRREVSKQINLLDFKLECLEHRRTPLFLQILGVTIRLKRSTVTMEWSIVFQPNLNFKLSVGAEIRVEEDGIKRLEKGGV